VKVKVAVPAGTQNGKVLRLRNKGVPKLRGSLDQRGDQYIKLIVETPRKLNREAKKLMSQLAEVLGENKNPEPVPFTE
jgi:molecular chaperone DnaJ